MSERDKKKIAPIVITVIIVLYYLVYFLLVMAAVPGILKLIFGIIPAVLGGVMLYVCIQRLDEINGGEEDDLSKY